MIRIGTIARRLVMFVFVIWLASTLNFFVPRLTPRNPIEEKLLSLTEFGGSTRGYSVAGQGL